MKHSAPLVWIDRKGLGRHVYVCFRLALRLREAPRKAVLNLFADSRYHLKVNGAFVNSGPARFYPACPEYDAHDITRLLRKGRNVLAVTVLSNGVNTFQVPLSRGALAAWGSVTLPDGERISLDAPGRWKCRRARGYDRTAPKFSFACGVIDVYDERKDAPGWDLPGASVKGWRAPVLLDEQDRWGRLRPRSIPLLTQDELLPGRLLGVWPLRDDEEFVSFRVHVPDATQRQYGGKKRVFARTWIHSPRKQTVRVGLFWGEHYLNGVGPLPKHRMRRDRPDRTDITLDLPKGWNALFVKNDVCWGTWDFYIALPHAAGLCLSAQKRRGSPRVFETCGPFRDAEEEAVCELPLPLEPDALAGFSARWVGHRRDGSAGNPAREMIWRGFAPGGQVEPSRVRDLDVDGGSPAAAVFDMGRETLGRIFVEFDAPRGTVIDVGHSEDLLGERPWILKRHGIFAADRHIARGGPSRLETFKPHGLRYLQVNVTGAPGPVHIGKVGVVEQVYPFEKLGRFECSDPMFNAIWELGWRTLRLCSEDSYTDCPWRERGLYAGDMLPELAITLATSGDTRLARRCLLLFQDKYARIFASDRRPSADRATLDMGVGDFPVITLLILGWTVDRTGDVALARKLYSPYRRMIDSLLRRRRPDGLLAEQRIFIDWTEMEKNGSAATMHALVSGACRALSRLAGVIGRKTDARRYAALGDDLARTVRRRFWDGARGAFRDAIKDGRPLESYFPASSAWPSLLGCTTAAQEKHLRAYYRTALEDIGTEAKHMTTSPYGGFYILGALYRHGHADLAEAFIRRHWGRMILAGADTAWEHFTDEQSQCHAWSGGPTYYLSTCVLGVDLGFPVASDPRRLVIAPQSESVDWARGVVPHPAGLVRVDWRVEGERLVMECDVPKAVRATVQPRGRLAGKELWVNGKRTRAT